MSEENYLLHTTSEPRPTPNDRYKAKEIENMRNKVSLPMLKAMVNAAAPARDFKAAILKRAAETGGTKAVCGPPCASAKDSHLAGGWFFRAPPCFLSPSSSPHHKPSSHHYVVLQASPASSLRSRRHPQARALYRWI